MLLELLGFDSPRPVSLEDGPSRCRLGSQAPRPDPTCSSAVAPASAQTRPSASVAVSVSASDTITTWREGRDSWCLQKDKAASRKTNQNGPGYACISCYKTFGTGKKVKAAADPKQTAITQFFMKQKQ